MTKLIFWTHFSDFFFLFSEDKWNEELLTNHFKDQLKDHIKSTVSERQKLNYFEDIYCFSVIHRFHKSLTLTITKNELKSESIKNIFSTLTFNPSKIYSYLSYFSIKYSSWKPLIFIFTNFYPSITMKGFQKHYEVKHG